MKELVHILAFLFQVSLNLEALTEAYDSSSSGPITDISTEGPHVNQLPVPSQPRPLSVGSGVELAGSSGGNTPRFEVVACRNQMAVSCCSKSLNLSIIICIYCGNIFRGKDHLYFQNAQKDKGIKESLENRMPRTNKPQNGQTAVNPSSQEPCDQTNNDILSGRLKHDIRCTNTHRSDKSVLTNAQHFLTSQLF